MRSPVGPADFLRAIAGLEASEEACAAIAHLLGYELLPEVVRTTPVVDSPRPPADVEEPEEADEPAEEAGSTGRGELLETPAVIEPSADRAPTVREPHWWSSTAPLEAEAPGQAWASPPPAPLFDPKRQRDILRALVGRRVPGRRVDVDALAGLMARHEPFDRLPQRVDSRAAHSVSVVALRSPHLEAFEQDVRALGRELRALAGQSAVSVRWVRSVPNELPDAEVVLVVVRGRPDFDGGQRPARAWFEAARRASALGASVYALTPETVEAQTWKPLRTIEWSRRTSAAHVTMAYRPRSIRTWHGTLELGKLLSPAVRIEPALLREMRLRCLPEQGPEIEAALRTSRWVDVSNSLGFTLRAEVRQRLLKRLARHPQRQLAHDVIERAHRRSAPVLRLEERLVRLAHLQPQNWQADVERALREANRALTPARAGLARWFERAGEQLPEGIRSTDAFAEVTLRSSAVLGRVTKTSPVKGLPPEVAAFLSQSASGEEIELLALDPESRPLQGHDLVGLPPEALARVARRLATSVDWLHSLSKRKNMANFRGDLVRRELDREARPEAWRTRVLVSVDERHWGHDSLREVLGEEEAFEARFLGPSELMSQLGEASAVFAPFEAPRREALIARAKDDPSFILCLLRDEPSEGASSFIEPYAEVIDREHPYIMGHHFRSLLTFAGSGACAAARGSDAARGEPRRTTDGSKGRASKSGDDTSGRVHAAGHRARDAYGAHASLLRAHVSGSPRGQGAGHPRSLDRAAVPCLVPRLRPYGRSPYGLRGGSTLRGDDDGESEKWSGPARW